MNAKARHRENRTRNLIVQAAFEEIWRVGFRSASLEAILKRAKVTKGALYHHFPNKQALGYAVVDEYIRWLIYDDFLRPLAENESDPIETLNSIVRARNRSAKHSDTTHDYSINVLGVNAIRLGCPLNNLAQEMSPLDEEFRIDEEFRKKSSVFLICGRRVSPRPSDVARLPVASVKTLIRIRLQYSSSL